MTLAAIGTIDWLVIAVYLAVMIGTGLAFSRREQKSTREYFLADRRMPMWAVAVSILATSLSAATFVGAPSQSYAGNLTYLSTNLGGLVAVFVVAWVFIPAFYRNNCTTVYELLETRFGPRAKHAASAAFMVGRVLASGSRIYIAAIPLSMIMFGIEGSERPEYLIGAIVALTTVAVVFTLMGGISSVIWTDVIQTGVMLVAVVAAITVLVLRIQAPVGEVMSTLSHAGANGTSKLTLLDPGVPNFSFGTPFTLITALVGISLLNIASYGTDHDMTQRMLTCRSAVQGGRSVFLSLAISVPVVAMFLTIGLLLYVFYQRPELMGSAAPGYAPTSNDRAFLTFIIREMPAGLRGLMIAGLFAVGIGSLNSAINAMAATFVKDFYVHSRPGKPEAHYLSVSRWVTLGWGAVLAGFAVVCVFWQRAETDRTLLDLALGVMTFCYAGLLAVFATALFTRRGTQGSVIAALVVGFVVVLLLQPVVYTRWTGWLGLNAPTIAWTWHMTIATPIAMLVCCWPRGTSERGIAST